MVLQLWVGRGGYFFLDTTIGVQVGQAWPGKNGWKLEVNDDVLDVADLDEAKRTFLLVYDPARVLVSPGSTDGGELDLHGFDILELRGDKRPGSSRKRTRKK
jgi:hypothetical protein